MNTTTFTYLLEHPESITADQTKEIRSLLDEFPYFQSAQALYLKGLKNQDSFTYNKALKVTAAHTTDRSVLFDYITSSVFSQNKISDQIKHQKKHLENITVADAEDLSIKVTEENLAKAENILSPDLFIEKENAIVTPTTTENTLQIGKPLDFNTNETYSFSEWLNIASLKPIQRKESKEKDTNSNKELDSLKESSENSLSRKRKEEIINSFIETNPKIKMPPGKKQIEKPVVKIENSPTDALMTETLARVYLEQKSYKKARLAYRILSLKYPEKSGFFADQIRAIRELEENKEL